MTDIMASKKRKYEAIVTEQLEALVQATYQSILSDFYSQVHALVAAAKPRNVCTHSYNSVIALKANDKLLRNPFRPPL
jgi:hypothetical protein